MHYSDEQFASALNEKMGNIRYYKAVLREKGLIGARQQFSEVHRSYFEEIRELKDRIRCTWETAIRTVLSEKIAENPTVLPLSENASEDIPGLLRQILQTLQRIEKKL
ncbi:hypothetical protein AB1I68_00075 [Paenibacillus pabuli]|uniref:hypothetical protein n=1 Tax=Paenibacillus pabuli TaxID=1472 RepID=UPI00345AF941